MKLHAADAKLVELARDSILADVAGGKLAPGARIDSAQIAHDLGIARQPIQQALAELRELGVVAEAPDGGLQVAPLDLGHVHDMYEVRAVLEGLAFRKAAERNPERARREGPELIQEGRRAVASGAVADMVEADMAFHDFVYELSENPCVAPAMAAHWTNTQRVMGEVLLRDEKPRDVWDQHEALLQAVIDSDAERAERLARDHVMHSAEFMIRRLQREGKK